jgi:hypothetical protein
VHGTDVANEDLEVADMVDKDGHPWPLWRKQEYIGDIIGQLFRSARIDTVAFLEVCVTSMKTERGSEPTRRTKAALKKADKEKAKKAFEDAQRRQLLGHAVGLHHVVRAFDSGKQGGAKKGIFGAPTNRTAAFGVPLGSSDGVRGPAHRQTIFETAGEHSHATAEARRPTRQAGPARVGASRLAAAAKRQALGVLVDDLFAEYDRSATGLLTPPQLAAMLSDLNGGRPVTETELAFVLRCADAGGATGVIDRDELRSEDRLVHILPVKPSISESVSTVLEQGLS